MWKPFESIIYLLASFLIIVVFSQNATGQVNTGMTVLEPHSLNTSRHFPSALYTQDKRVEMGFNFWMGNTNISYASMRDFYQSEKLTAREVEDLIGQMGRQNAFGIAQQYMIGGSWKDSSDITWSVSIEDQVGIDLQYSRQFFELAWRGNAPFAGETIELTPLQLNAHYQRAFTIGASYPLGSDFRNQGWRIGGRLQLIQGLATIRMKNNHVTMYTEPNGRYIDFDFDYKIQEAGFQNFNWFRPNGYGAGLSLGATRFLNDELTVRLGINDLGFVTYNRETRKYSKDRKVRYEGLVISNLFGGSPELDDVDSLSSIFVPDEGSGQNFTVPLSTRVALQSRYEFEGFFRFKETLWATYLMGLNDMPGNPRIPLMNLSYKVAGDSWVAGPSVTVGGYQRWGVGMMLAYEFFDRFQVRATSDNLIPLFAPDAAYGFEGGVQLGYAF